MKAALQVSGAVVIMLQSQFFIAFDVISNVVQ